MLHVLAVLLYEIARGAAVDALDELHVLLLRAGVALALAL